MYTLHPVTFAPGSLLEDLLMLDHPRQKLSLLSLIACTSLLPCSAAENGTLTVRISGLSNDKGVVRVALFDSQSTYSDRRMGADGAVRLATLPIRGKGCQWVVKGLSPGTYAVRVFHDEDKSGKFKVNRLGIPRYEYGFSNNARAIFGPPGFDKAKFEFPKVSIQKIKLHR